MFVDVVGDVQAGGGGDRAQHGAAAGLTPLVQQGRTGHTCSTTITHSL